ncbi:TPA: hypothetical protein EYP66_03180 [Candidatus Poribacteria bacterium]|nr:hypothetical protein [Candidatus Poribacteria bacterium]
MDKNYPERCRCRQIPDCCPKGNPIDVPVAINDATGLIAGGIILKYDQSVIGKPIRKGWVRFDLPLPWLNYQRRGEFVESGI